MMITYALVIVRYIYLQVEMYYIYTETDYLHVSGIKYILVYTFIYKQKEMGNNNMVCTLIHTLTYSIHYTYI